MKMMNIGCVGHQKGRLCNGTTYITIKEYTLHGKFHAFFKKCTAFALCCSTIRTCVQVNCMVVICPIRISAPAP